MLEGVKELMEAKLSRVPGTLLAPQKYYLKLKYWKDIQANPRTVLTNDKNWKTLVKGGVLWLGKFWSMEYATPLRTAWHEGRKENHRQRE